MVPDRVNSEPCQPQKPIAISPDRDTVSIKMEYTIENLGRPRMNG